MSSVTDGDGLRKVVEQLVEQALRTGARRPEPVEVRHVADGLCDALTDYIDRQVATLQREVERRLATLQSESPPYWRQHQ